MKMMNAKWTSIMLLGCILFATVCHARKLYEELESSNGLMESKRPSFYAGSRYGRSQYFEPDTTGNLQVAPRRDYHFLRYGKRSDELEDNNQSTIKCYETARGFVLTCSFTGVQDYYRCWKGQEIKATTDEKLPKSGDN